MTDKPGTPAARTMRAQGLVNLAVQMAAANPAFARLSRVHVDQDGNASHRDLHLAWVGGARVIKLTPR